MRLKSGDPMIFGRAGEEIAALEAENIPVEIVPCITAASAMASRLGVSLTHRDHAQSVRFVTGHSRQGKLPENIDWQSLSNPSVTTVLHGRANRCQHRGSPSGAWHAGLDARRHHDFRQPRK